MKERPIAFNAAMVKAILAGNKSHTRRTSRIPQDTFDIDYEPTKRKWVFLIQGGGKPKYRQCPYGVPGDRLWVKEPWVTLSSHDELKPSDLPERLWVSYTRNRTEQLNPPAGYRVGKSRSAMFMPRWASRILLEVSSVNCERLQSINHDQAISEGITQVGMFGRFPRYRDYQGYNADGFLDGVSSFASLWDTINGSKEGKRWIDNPWVWDVEFRVLEVRV